MPLPDWRVPPLFELQPVIWKRSPEDFRVDEIWAPPDWGGEHHLLRIHKRGANTHWVARQLARFSGVRDMDVAYMGLKDRQACTSQYFSVYLGKRAEPDWSRFQAKGVEASDYLGRIPRKLRRGQHFGNRFRIVLAGGENLSARVEESLRQLRLSGFPNAFGPQRFGHEGDNIQRGLAWLVHGQKPDRREKRSLYLSAVRSALFNAQLAERVRSGTWRSLLPGDSSIAPAMAQTVGSVGRRVCGVPAGVLSGGERDGPPLLRGLHEQGVREQLRPLVAFCPDLEWHGVSRLTLSFTLGVGCYASSLLQTLFHLDQDLDPDVD